MLLWYCSHSKYLWTVWIWIENSPYFHTFWFSCFMSRILQIVKQIFFFIIQAMKLNIFLFRVLYLKMCHLIYLALTTFRLSYIYISGKYLNRYLHYLNIIFTDTMKYKTLLFSIFTNRRWLSNNSLYLYKFSYMYKRENMFFKTNNKIIINQRSYQATHMRKHSNLSIQLKNILFC